MDPAFYQIFFTFTLTILVFMQIPSYFCQFDQLNETCSQPFECANEKEIGYPFWGGDRPVSCGYPGFELNCQDDVPLLNISSMLYRVLEINNTSKTLKVARQDLWNNFCPTTRLNTTLNFNLFDFYSTSGDRNITLFYGCTTLPNLPPPPPGSPLLNLNQFDCNVGVPNSENFFMTQNASIAIRSTINCNSNITVPVNFTLYSAISTAPSISTLEIALESGFSIQWSANNSRCDNCVRSGGVCGYNPDSASFACYTRTGNGSQFSSGSNLGLKMLIGISVSIAGGIVLVSPIIVWLKRRRSRLGLNQETNQNVENFLLNNGSLAPKRYNYSEIKKITKSFNDKIGQGGYGSVYKGMLPNGSLVAVKLLTESSGNGDDFINEVASISRTSHVNIVNLLGFCYDRNKIALVYEFMPNKSLDKFIYNNGSLSTDFQLDWEKLYKIAVGVARGLEYLHRGCHTRIVHFDIKPQNILLDEDFCPKISDFGLARLCQKKQSVLSMLGTRGTAGFIAPEVFSRTFGGVSHKSDVYSYGMMVLEMVGARNIIGIESIKSSENYFPDQIYEHVVLRETKNLDNIVSEEEEESTRKMFLVGFWCIQTIPSDRPSMSKVVDMLEGSLQSIQIPPKPFLFSPMPLRKEFPSSELTNVETENSLED